MKQATKPRRGARRSRAVTRTDAARALYNSATSARARRRACCRCRSRGDGPKRGGGQHTGERPRGLYDARTHGSPRVGSHSRIALERILDLADDHELPRGVQEVLRRRVRRLEPKPNPTRPGQPAVESAATENPEHHIRAGNHRGDDFGAGAQSCGGAVPEASGPGSGRLPTLPFGSPLSTVLAPRSEPGRHT